MGYTDPEDLELPSGETISLRGLSGFEVMLSRKKHHDDEVGQNAFILSCAMGITEDAALAWMKSHSAGDFTEATDTVQRRSGLSEEASKEARKSTGG